MATPNVLRKVKIDGKWLMLPVVKVGDRFDWSKVVHKGQPTVVTEGTFYLEYREQGRRVRRAVGNHPRDAKAALETQGSVLELRSKGVEVEDAPQIVAYHSGGGKTVRSVVKSFVEAPPLKLRRKSFLKYRNALESFLQSGSVKIKRRSRRAVRGPAACGWLALPQEWRRSRADQAFAGALFYPNHGALSWIGAGARCRRQ